jgi:hypothetical protein
LTEKQSKGVNEDDPQIDSDPSGRHGADSVQ